MRVIRFVILFFCCSVALSSVAKDKIRVACVGNSVTYGMTLTDREHTCYPYVLQQLLGEEYDVRNFGHSGTTLLRHGHRPYVNTDEYRQAIDFAADKVVIHLGLNDTDPRNWPDYGDEFIVDYRSLIDSFRMANPKAEIWICLMTPISHRHPRFQSGTRDWHAAIQKRIRQIAATADVELIDINTPLYSRPELFPDGLHPNEEGARILAKTVYSALTGDFGGLSLPPLYTDGMVLQRGDSIVLHGKANAGEFVTVKFNGTEQKVKSMNDGSWHVSFRKIDAGGPYKLSFKTKKRTISFNEVWVGEVWLCSGQSNMEFPLRLISTAEEDLASADACTLLHLCDMSTLYPTDATEWSPSVLDSVNHLRLLRSPQWTRCNRDAASRFSAIAYHFGRVLADSLKVPVGIICNAVGGTTTESWIDRKTLEKNFPQVLYDWYHGDFGQPWARGRALQNIKQAQTPLQRHPYEPCYMFEAGILPLDHYNIKGVTWYQGESNAHNVELHEKLFRLLRDSWRNYFGNKNLAFHYVQLSSLNRPSWPSFRDSQRRLWGQHSKMVVSHDCGDSLDVHYANKRPIGERLAWVALTDNYKFQLRESPRPVGADIYEGRVRIAFSGAKGSNEGLHPATGDKILGFEVAGEDGLFYAAEAHVAGYYVLLTCPKVTNPVIVRYAWQPFTRANLVNEANLPTSTFKIAVSKYPFPWIFD